MKSSNSPLNSVMIRALGASLTLAFGSTAFAATIAAPKIASTIASASAKLTFSTTDTGTMKYLVAFASGSSAPACTSGTTLTTASVTESVHANETYTVNVCSKDSKSNVSAQATLTFTTPAVPVPSVTLSSVTSEKAIVTWSTAGGNPADYWVGISAAGASALSCAQSTKVAGTVTSKTFSDLKPGQTYEVTVCGMDSNSDYSNPAVLTVVATPLPSPQNFAVSTLTPNAVTVAWNSPGNSDITGYLVDLAAGSSPPACSGTAQTALSKKFDTTPGTSYMAAVCSRDADGDLSPAATLSFTAPQVPVPLATLTSLTETSAIVGWTSPMGAPAQFSVGIATGLNAPACSAGAKVASTDLSKTFSSLTAGYTYSVTVCGVDSAGGYSTPSSLTFQTALSPSSDVTTAHGDNFRTGQNLYETTLNRTNVNPSDFGKIAALPVDGQVYAQPLLLSGVDVPGRGTMDLLFVVTENDSVYAFDAQGLSTTPVWQRSFLGDSHYPCTDGPCVTLTPADSQCPNIFPVIGITATPVIDPTTKTIYITATTKENGVIYWKLHALSVETGDEIKNSPVTIEGSVDGKGDGSVDGKIAFTASTQLSRSGLVLDGGTVYVPFTSYNDREPTHGWVFGYNASSLAKGSTFITTPATGDGTIWQAGGAPGVDASGNIFFATGNGDPAFSATDTDYADSVLKLTAGTLALSDYFTPYNHIALANGDVDLGSGGVLLLPEQPGPYPELLVAGGKQGTVYLLNRNNLGKLNKASGASSDSQIVQELVGDIPGGKNYGPGIYGTPGYFGGKVFIGAAGDYLRSIPVSNGLLNWSGMEMTSQEIALRGASPSISANGASNGIVWYLDASAFTYGWVVGTTDIPILTNGPSILYAYSTDNLSTPLYSSKMNAGDAAGDAVKYAVPTVSHGMVFVGTDTEVSVYGLLSRQANNRSKNNRFRTKARALAAKTPPARGIASTGKAQTAPADSKCVKGTGYDGGACHTAPQGN